MESDRAVLAFGYLFLQQNALTLGNYKSSQWGSFVTKSWIICSWVRMEFNVELGITIGFQRHTLRYVHMAVAILT